MKTHEKELLRRFKNGDLSINEKTELRDISKHSNDLTLKTIKSYFQAIEIEKNKKSSLINSPFVLIKRKNLRLRRIFRNAAIMIILISISLFINNRISQTVNGVKYSQAEIEDKYKQTLRVLSVCSESFKQGMEQFQTMSKLNESKKNHTNN